MSRRRRAVSRPIPKDAKFNSSLVTRLVNTVMGGGKKSVAQRIVYGAFDELVAKHPATNPLEVLQRAVDNAKPRLEVKARRVGGATYQVPKPVVKERGLALAVRWILESARKKKGSPMKDKLADELINAANNAGVAVKKKEDTHRMAEANRAFAHFKF